LYESSIKRGNQKRFENRCSATFFVRSTPAIQGKILLSLSCVTIWNKKN
jgi:hypothetical protein